MAATYGPGPGWEIQKAALREHRRQMARILYPHRKLDGTEMVLWYKDTPLEGYVPDEFPELFGG